MFAKRTNGLVMASLVAIILAGLLLAACQSPVVVTVPPTPDPMLDVEASRAGGYNVNCYREQGGDKITCASGGEIQVESGATLDVQSGATFNIGSIYPLLYATAGYEVACGTTGTFTGTTTVSVASLSAISYAVATQITDPASTGAWLTVDQPTTTTLTINSWETDATVGTTGVNGFYCAVGAQ